jgi:hypothetical protein
MITAIRVALSRLRTLRIPIIVLGGCIAAIFAMRGLSGKPKVALIMQAEMNRQFDMFQAALARASDAQVEMQKRMLQAEKIRGALVDQFERSQRELIETQKALQGANMSLLATQEALRRVQEDYESLRDDKAAKIAEAPAPVAKEVGRDPAGEISEKLEDLEKLRQDNLQAARAVSNGMDYFNRLWAEYAETGGALTLVRAKLAGQFPGRMEFVHPHPVDQRPDFGSEILVGGAEQDVAPQLSPALLQMWIAERLNMRSGEMIALQRRITRLNRAIEETERDLIARQKALSQARAVLAERTSKQ